MKITQVGVNSINPYKKQAQKVEKAASNRNQGLDKLEISSTAKEMQVSSFTQSRTERIQQLKQSIDAGTYEVNPRAVAEGVASFYKL